MVILYALRRLVNYKLSDHSTRLGPFNTLGGFSIFFSFFIPTRYIQAYSVPVSQFKRTCFHKPENCNLKDLSRVHSKRSFKFKFCFSCWPLLYLFPHYNTVKFCTKFFTITRFFKFKLLQEPHLLNGTSFHFKLCISVLGRPNGNSRQQAGLRPKMYCLQEVWKILHHSNLVYMARPSAAHSCTLI